MPAVAPQPPAVASPAPAVDLAALRQQVKAEAKATLAEHPELLDHALASFGVDDIVGEMKKAAAVVKDEALVVVGEIAGDLTDEMDDTTNAFLSALAPFMTDGMHALTAKEKTAPLAYDAVRGAALLKEMPSWAWLMWSLRPLHRCPQCATLFLLLFFLFGMWSIAIYNLFTDADTGACCTWLVPIMLAGGESGLQFFIGFAAVLMVPFAVLLASKLVINTSELPLCGALVKKLEDHYAPGVAAPWGGEGHGGVKKGVLWRTHRDLASRADRYFTRYYVIVAVLIVAAMAFQYISKFVTHGHVTAIVQLVVTLSFALLALPALLASLLLVIHLCVLIKANLTAYKDLLDLLCVQVTLVHQKTLASLNAEKAGNPLEQARLATRLDPLVIELTKSLKDRELFLLAVSKAVIKGQVGKSINGIYAFWAAFYFFQLFDVVLTFIRLRLGGSVTTATLSFAMLTTAAMILGLVFLAGPLWAMAAQSRAWSRVVRGLKSAPARAVSSVLSPRLDPNELYQHHAGLLDDFTWTILGQVMSYAAIGTAIASYVGLLWVGIVLPAMSDYQEQLRAQVAEVMDNATAVLSQIQSQIG